MAIDPRAVKFHTLGNKLVEEQKYNEAIVNYEKAIGLEPTYAVAHYHLAEAYEYKKLDDQAYESYLKAMEYNPNYATIHIESGLDTLLSGPLGKAVAEFKKAKGGAKGGGGVAVPTPKEGSPVAMATQPAVKKAQPRGQKGLKPMKVHLRPSDENYSSEVGSVDTVIAEVLGPKEIPVAECKVTFKVRNEPPLDDAAVGADAAQAESEQGSKALMLTTDGDGRVTAYFKRSKRTGLNKLEVRPEGGVAVFFEDNTHPGDVERVDILPTAKHFTTGQQVKFSFSAFDRFENRIEGLDLDVTLLGKKRDKWEIIDNMSGKTDSKGCLEHEFTMPTLGNMACRMEVKHKKTEFNAEKAFKVIPGTASSMIFIPAKNVVNPGEKFVLKMRLMDEFDNPIEGLYARIIQKEAIGGVWRTGAPDSEITGEDGSVCVEITAPKEPGARVVYGVETDSLSASSKIEAQFTTGQALAAAPERTTELSAVPDLDLDMAPPPDLTSGHPKMETSVDTGFKSDDLSAQLSGIELGAGDISGLPDLDAAPLNATPAIGGKAAGPAFEAPILGEGLSGGMSALEGLELDIGAPAPAAAPKPPSTPIQNLPGQGSSFEQLDSMLDTDYVTETKEKSGVGDIAPIAAKHNDDFSVPESSEYYDENGQQESPAADSAAAETSESFGLEVPPDEDISFVKPRDKQEKYLDLKIDQEEITCRAGDVIPVKACVVGADGRPVSAGISVSFTIEDTGAGRDSFFVTPSGLQGEKAYQTEPDLAGEAVSNVQVSSRCGSFGIVIEIEGVQTRVKVNIAPGVPSTIELFATTETLSPGETVVITAKVEDKYGNPVPGEFVSVMPENYTGQPGTISQDSTTTDEAGEVAVTYTASPNPGDTMTLTAQNPSVGAFAVKKVSLTVAGEAAAAPPATTAGSKGGTKPQKAEQPASFELGGLPPLPDGAGIGGPAFESAFQPLEPVAATSVQPAAAPAPKAQRQAAAPPSAPAEFVEPEETTEERPDEEVDDYLKSLEPTDPYAAARFEIKRGKKPVMELSTLLPKIMKYVGILLCVAGLAAGGLVSYKYFLFEYYNTQAIQKYTEDRLGEALILFDKAHKVKPNVSEPLEYSAEIYIKQAEKAEDAGNDRQAAPQYDAALELLKKVQKINPNNIDGLFMLGQAYEGKKMYCRALEQYQNILQVDPNYQIAQSKTQILTGMCGSYRRLRGRGM